MTITRTSAKAYFETGDKPSQAQFAELFEGIVFQTGVSAQAVQSNVSALGNWDFKKDVTVSGAVTTGALSITGTVSANALNVTTAVSAATLGISGAAVVGGAINVAGLSTFAGGIVGKTNGAAAASGNVGQLVQSSVAAGSAVACSNNQTQNVTFIDVPAGFWLIWANGWSNPAGGTTTTIFETGISTTSSAQPTPPNGGGDNRWAGSIVGTGISSMVQIVANVSATVRHYLVVTPTFSGSTLAAYGSIQAIRMPI